jgi:glutaredoxin-related protein
MKKIVYLHGNEVEYDEIEGMGHRTPLDVFINMYDKHS